jgi:ABC-2 type transport system permease protein
MRRDAVSRTAALIRHNTILLLREPGPLISRTVMPLGFDIIIRPLDVATQGTRLGTEQAVTGSVVMFSLLMAYIVGSAILTERIWGTWDRMRATAVHPLELLAGKVIPAMGALLAMQLVVLGFGVLVQGMAVAEPLLLVVAAVAWTLALLGIGAALGVLSRTISEMSAAFDIGGIMLSGLGGTVVPLSVLPHWVHVAAPISPAYWALAAMHGALQGHTSAALTASLALLAFAAGFAAVAALGIVRGGARSAKM